MTDFVIVDWTECLGAALAGAAFASKCVEYQNEARRCRQIVHTIMEKTDVNGLSIEFYTYKPVYKETDPGMGLVLCAPGLDEGNFAAPAKDILAWYFDRLGIPNTAYAFKDKTIRMGTESDS